MEQKKYWGKTLASFFLVLCTMPLGHALMKVMEATLSVTALHYAAFAMGLVGLAIAIAGVFVKGDTQQTLCGLFLCLLRLALWRTVRPCRFGGGVVGYRVCRRHSREPWHHYQRCEYRRYDGRPNQGAYRFASRVSYYAGDLRDVDDVHGYLFVQHTHGLSCL